MPIAFPYTTWGNITNESRNCLTPSQSRSQSVAGWLVSLRKENVSLRHLNMKLERRQWMVYMELQGSCLVCFFKRRHWGVISQTNRDNSFKWKTERTWREGQMDGIRGTAGVNEASITVRISLLNVYMSLFIIFIYFLFIKFRSALKFSIFSFQILLVLHILRPLPVTRVCQFEYLLERHL